jgi:phosphatidylglycerophosphate synthase
MNHPENATFYLIPSAISLAGGALAIDGARRIDTPFGIAEVAVGRSLDLVDGPVARSLDQTSELGAAIDATTDKLAGLAILVNEWRKDVAPRSALLAIAAQNLLSGAATVAAQHRYPDQELRPSRDGKRAMFAQNVALGAYAISHVVAERRPRAAQVLRGLGHVATVVGVGHYGLRATAGYIRRAAGQSG